jgi:hypothetical protein
MAATANALIAKVLVETAIVPSSPSLGRALFEQITNGASGSIRDDAAAHHVFSSSL